MSDYPTGHLDTKFGKVEFTWTNAKHVHIGGQITVRCVDYTVSANLHLIGGEWRREKEHDWHNPYVNRLSSDPNWDKGASDSARKAIWAELVAIWSAYAAGHGDVGQHAERVNVNSELNRIDDKISELEAELVERRTERAAKLAELNKIGGPI